MAVASGATAAGIAAVLATASFALQAVALPRPSDDQLIATRAVRWLTSHDAVESVRTIGGRRVSSVCVNTWVGPLSVKGKPTRGSLLIRGHTRLVDTRFASFQAGRTLREVDGPQPAVEVALAGCPRALARRIGGLLDHRVPVRAERARLGGRSVLRLTFARSSGGLALVVRTQTFAPVAVRLPLRRNGWTYLSPAEPRDLARLRQRLSRRVRLLVKEDA